MFCQVCLNVSNIFFKFLPFLGKIPGLIFLALYRVFFARIRVSKGGLPFAFGHFPSDAFASDAILHRDELFGQMHHSTRSGNATCFYWLGRVRFICLSFGWLHPWR